MIYSPHSAGHRHNTRKPDLSLGEKTESPWLAWRDEDLLAEYVRQGTREAFEELVHRYKRPLSTYLRHYLGDAGMAEDTLQVTFLEVHLRCREFDPHRTFRSWVYCIANTRAIDLLRRNRRHKLTSLDARGWNQDSLGDDRPTHDVPDTQARTPLEQLETTESRQQLRLLVNSLPARLSNVLELVMFRDFAYHEAAEALGIPIGTVKSRIHKAISHLRKIGVAAA